MKLPATANRLGRIQVWGKGYPDPLPLGRLRQVLREAYPQYDFPTRVDGLRDMLDRPRPLPRLWEANR